MSPGVHVKPPPQSAGPCQLLPFTGCPVLKVENLEAELVVDSYLLKEHCLTELTLVAC